MSDVPAVRVQGVSKLYRQGGEVVPALRGVDLDIWPGEWCALVGRSGSGKTTLLDIIGTLLQPTEGRVYIDGTDVTALSDRRRTRLRGRKIGFVFQDYNLLPGQTGLGNVMLPLQYDRRTDLEEGLRRARELLHEVGLGDRAGHRPEQLSGGEQQRVAIARALVHQPALVLADEPTAAVDSKTTGILISLLRKLNREHGVTIVLATHDLEIARSTERVIMLSDGLVVSDGRPERGTAPERGAVPPPRPPEVSLEPRVAMVARTVNPARGELSIFPGEHPARPNGKAVPGKMSESRDLPARHGSRPPTSPEERLEDPDGLTAEWITPERLLKPKPSPRRTTSARRRESGPRTRK